MSNQLEKLANASAQVVKDECPYSPATCYKKLNEAISDIDDLVAFKKLEELSNFEGEYKTLQLSIKDANVAALHEENVHLTDELKLCKDSLDFDKKEANIKLFQLQRELEQKNIEILLLKKDKSEFDLQINLLKFKCASKEKELQDALNVSHSGQNQTDGAKSDLNQKLLEEELIESKWKIKNLEETLKIKSLHNQLLSEAFDELLNDFKQISSETIDIFETIQINESIAFDSIEPIDLNTLDTVTGLINVEIPPFNIDNYVSEYEITEVDAILKESVSNLTFWFKSVLDEWQSQIDDPKIPDNNDIEDLWNIYHQFSSKSLYETANNDAVEIGLQTSFIEMPIHAISEENKLSMEVDNLKKELIESKTELDKLTNEFENKISALKEENEELLQKYNSTNTVLLEAEKHQSHSNSEGNELAIKVDDLKRELIESKTELDKLTNEFENKICALKEENEELLQKYNSTNTVLLEAEKHQSHSNSKENELAIKVDDLKRELIENKTELGKLTNEFENKISALKEENEELLQKYNSTKDVLQEAEKHQSFVEETTAEVVKELKEELGDRTIKLLLNGGQEDLNDLLVDVILKNESEVCQTSGMSTFLTAKDEPEPSICVDRDVTLSVGTAYALPREHSDNLVRFAQEFAEFLLANQVFVQDDALPTDPSVFYFLLDRYLILVETYHQTRSAFEENLKSLEEQDKVMRMKGEALISQLSQLDNSTLYDSSLTASSVDFTMDARSSTMYENKLNDTSLHLDLTHDPLQITMPSTPITAKSRLSFRDATPAQKRSSLNNSKIPVSRAVTPSAHMRTLNESSVRHSILLNGSVNESMLPPSTPLQKILRRDPCSTAKKCVTFQSPLLAKNAIEYENSKLKTLLDEKLAQIDKLEDSIANHVSNVEQIEKRIEELEKLSSEAYNALERAESEFSEKRDKLEGELNHVKSQLADVTNKLIVEAINLDPDLQNRVTAITPPQVLKKLLDTIIARCEKAREETKIAFEQDREEWANEILQVTSSNQSLQQKLDELTCQNKQMALQCEELGVLEEDLLRLTAENIQFEKANANLEKESKDLQEKLLELEAIKEEIVMLKNKLFMAEGEKECLISDKYQLEEDKEKLGKEYDNQLKVLENAIADKNEQVGLLNLEITELRNNTALLEDTNAKITKENENYLQNLNEKGQILEAMKVQISTLENEIAGLHLARTNIDKNKADEIESFKLELENSNKENENYLKISNEKDQMLSTLKEEVRAMKDQISTLENEISGLHFAKTNADSNNVVEFESLKLELENSKKENENYLKISNEKDQMLSTLKEELNAKIDQIITLENEIADLQLAKTNMDKNKFEEIESLNLKLENSKKENENYLKTSNEKDQVLTTLTKELDAVKNQASSLKKEIADLQLFKSNSDNEKSESLKIENSAKENELKVLTEKNQTLQEELNTIKTQVLMLNDQTTTYANKTEEFESMKLALENSSKEKEILESQNEEYKSSLNQISALKNHAEKNIEMAESAIETISQKFMCESILPCDLASKIHHLCNLVSKKLNDLEEENKRISLLEKEIADVKDEKKKMDILMKEVQLDAQNLKMKVSQLEDDKCSIENELTKLTQQIADMEETGYKLQSEIEKKDELLVSHAAELELFKIKIAEKELESKGDKNIELKQLQEQKLFAEAQQVEINNLKENIKIIQDELNCLKTEKETILSQISTCTLQFEAEVENHKKATLKVNNLEFEVSNLREELEGVRGLEVVHKSDMDVITIQKSELEECLSAVEQNLRLAEERLLSAEARNLEFETEMLLLKDELTKNKITTEELTEKFLKLEKIYGDAKNENSSLMKKLDDFENVLTEKDCLANQLEELKKCKDSLSIDKEEMNGKITGLTEKYTSEKTELLKQLNELEEIKTSLTSEKQNLLKDLLEVNSAVKILNEEKLEFQKTKISYKNENDLLNMRLKELSQAGDSLKMEKDLLTTKISELNQTVSGFTTEKDSLFSELQTAIENRSVLVNEINILQIKLAENNDILKTQTEEKSILISKLDEITQSRDILETENKDLAGKVEKLTNDLEEKSKNLTELVNKIEFFDHSNEKLKEKLEQYKITESSMLKKLLEKNSSDEMVHRLQSQLKDAESIISDLNAEVKSIREELKSKTDSVETALSELTDLTSEIKHLKGVIGDLHKDNDVLKNNFMEQGKELNIKSKSLDNATLLIEKRDKENEDKLNNLNNEIKKLSNNNAEFQVKEAEFLTFGREMDHKIQDLTNKLMKLESAPSRRSKRQDPIGPRRLEKLEDLNTTLHDLLLKVLTMLNLPIVEKLRLISQREVDGATKQILEHAATLVNAQKSLESLKEQVKSLDQENQELSDNCEALLKDNNKLELKIIDLEKSHKSSDCSKCIKLQTSLKEKTDKLDELLSQIKQLDEENDALSSDVEALFKDNNKLELKIIDIQNGSDSLKSCSECSTFKKNLKKKEEEISELKSTIKKNSEQLEEANEKLTKLKAKCEQFETSLASKEQYILRAINERVRGDEVQMRGVSGGMVRDIDLNDKLRRLTKDNDTLKVQLKERARTIKNYEAEQKSNRLTTSDPNAVMNTNSMDSPIRERNYNLRTRGDLQSGNKRSLRPNSEGIENIRI